MATAYNVFDPSQWADVTGFVVVLAMACVTIVGVLAKLTAGTRWGDWLDEAHGRGSVDDPWEDRPDGR